MACTVRLKITQGCPVSLLLGTSEEKGHQPWARAVGSLCPLEGLFDLKRESVRRRNGEDEPLPQQPAHPEEVGLHPSLSAVSIRVIEESRSQFAFWVTVPRSNHHKPVPFRTPHGLSHGHIDIWGYALFPFKMNKANAKRNSLYSESDGWKHTFPFSQWGWRTNLRAGLCSHQQNTVYHD